MINFFQNIFKKTRSKSDGFFYNRISNIIGRKPKNIDLYTEAFTHATYNKKKANYERLEYLGDAILGAIIADYLFHKSPNKKEGYLTQMRSKLVSRDHLNKVGKELELDGILKSNLSKPISDKIYGNLFESLIGAIYLDKGFKFTTHFVLEKFISEMVDFNQLERKITSYKGYVYEWAQKHKKNIQFKTIEENSAEKELFFTSSIYLDKKLMTKGRATSKKKSEEIAAKRLYYKTRNSPQK